MVRVGGSGRAREREVDAAPPAESSPAPAKARTRSRTLVAWRDPLMMLALFLLALWSRWPYRMRWPYAWDSLLFVRAVEHFNATIHQPQPPGYLFYVSAARLLRLLMIDPHRALVWVSVLASAVAVAGLYLLATLLYDRITGIIAASFLLTSATFWFYSELAYPYTTLAAGSIALATLAISTRRQILPGGGGVALAFLAYGLVGGFRQDLLLFLGPLFVAALWGRPTRSWAIAIAAGTCGVACWLLPTAALSEGFGRYLAATLGQGAAASEGSSGFTIGPAAFARNGREVAIFLRQGLQLLLLPLAYLLARLPFRRPEPALGLLLLWLAPPLAFYVLAHIGDYGYTFSVLPALAVLAARGVTIAARDAVALGDALLSRVAAGRPDPLFRPRHVWRAALALGAGGILALGNGLLFVHPATQFTAIGLRCFDETMGARLRLVRADFRPEETIILAAGYWQHVRYFLPEYRAWLYAPDAGAQAEWTVPPGVRQVVVFDETARPPAGAADFARYTLPCNHRPFYHAAVRTGDIVQFDGATATVAIHRGPR